MQFGLLKTIRDAKHQKIVMIKVFAHHTNECCLRFFPKLDSNPYQLYFQAFFQDNKTMLVYFKNVMLCVVRKNYGKQS